MRAEWILPTILILIDIGAGLVYLIQGELRMFIYWISASLLTATVTYR